jgi:hypothetical protein
VIDGRPYGKKESMKQFTRVEVGNPSFPGGEIRGQILP